MSYAIRAWRDTKGARGITIGICIPASGWENVVAEEYVTEEELDGFISELREAMQRATAATAPLDEGMPGAYDSRGWSQT